MSLAGSNTADRTSRRPHSTPFGRGYADPFQSSKIRGGGSRPSARESVNQGAGTTTCSIRAVTVKIAECICWGLIK